MNSAYTASWLSESTQNELFFHNKRHQFFIQFNHPETSISHSSLQKEIHSNMRFSALSIEINCSRTKNDLVDLRHETAAHRRIERRVEEAPLKRGISISPTLDNP
jgi:hypothetical protein